MQRQSQTILVVEDNPDDFEATTRSLRKANISNPIDHCIDGEQALDYLYQRGEYADANLSRPGLVLLDLNLPGTDGYEVLHEMKQDAGLKSIPVIVLTTSSDERDIETCYAAGANSYMLKTVDLNGFMAAISRMSDFWLDIALLPRQSSP